MWRWWPSKSERLAKRLGELRGDVDAQVAFVRDRCCEELLAVVDRALRDGRLEDVYTYPAAIAFWLRRDSAAWLDADAGGLTWVANAKTAHEQWLGLAYCAIHQRVPGIAIVVDS